ncbi:MAG: hypothetical protein HQ526_04140 [Actinobacteria bacterium]|nr:hypothetical protein [Actinomycetota bacterium]
MRYEEDEAIALTGLPVRRLDLNDLVCPEVLCPAVDANGLIIYVDNNHLTPTFTLSLWQALDAPITKALRNEGFR